MAEGTMKYKFTLYFSVFVWCAFGMWLGTLAADREMPVVMYDVEALTPFVDPGGELKVEYAVFRRRSCEVQIDRFIYDSGKVRWPLLDTNINAGLPLGEEHYVVPVKIPEGAMKGPAFYRISPTYICNPLQRLWPISGGSRDVAFIIR